MQIVTIQESLTEMLALLGVPENKKSATLTGMSSAALFELRLKMNELAVLKKQNAELQQALAIAGA